ncbi:hypothetical protein EST38_g4625 [Candolleomyces aberdarensis]|uniref:CBM1 domain-containing protein n=1 Tax=Candolleomyces aberdarensis TaxID=2316362 RepID=A0A4Q2DP83_9AGAR|nr:hypothetical protein EST38_g4625 [Candolleomyces aberdarensis]
MLKLLTALLAFTVTGTIAAKLVGPFAQCGGIGYDGDTTCYPGYACTELNDWYSECQPVDAPIPTNP